VGGVGDELPLGVEGGLQASEQAVDGVGPAGWLLRLTPAAAFAVQQTLVQYPQVANTYIAAYGYYPLPPLAGLAVLCAWAALALGLAFFLLRRRDA
jgi:hypothetical protein